jgi:hypothetical protein
MKILKIYFKINYFEVKKERKLHISNYTICVDYPKRSKYAKHYRFCVSDAVEMWGQILHN